LNPIETFLGDLDAFFDGGNHWQAGLFQLISELTLEQALFRPTVERHCIWEVLRHINFWKMYAIAYVTDTEKPDRRKNWVKTNSNLSSKDWKNQLAELKKVHEGMKDALNRMGDTVFDIHQRKSNYIRQIICHDSYHTGQIGVLRAMQGLKPII
jgi:uncharacterized damage-inducible protein DinB